jgi:hypothetical protein
MSKLITILFFLPFAAFGQTVETFTTNGSWTCPEGVTSVTVECWGGGGAGGGARGNPCYAGGGAGGQYAIKVDNTVSAGNSYSYVVGGASTASASAVVNGNPTSWRTNVVVAAGGAGGALSTTTGTTSAGGAGTDAGGTGTTVYAGGSGADGVAATRSGGGGGGAGSTGTGNTASASAVDGGAAKSEYGGKGGNGVTSGNTRNNGAVYGAGGSGGCASNSTDRAGGNGAAGFIRITYTVQIPSFTQVRFRFYADGTEDGSTPIATEGTDLSGSTAVATVNHTLAAHLRVLIQETAGNDGAATDDWQLYVSKNAGAYAAVTGSSSNVKSYAGTLTDQEATTNRSTNGLTDGSGSFVAGKVDEANGEITDVQVTASNFTELVWSIQVVSADVADGDVLDFKVYRNGTAITTYTDIPRITISKGTAPTVALNTPTDAATGQSTTPDLIFTPTDTEGDAVEINIQVDANITFDSGVTSGTVASYNEASRDDQIPINSTIQTYAGQTFTPASTYTLTSAKFYLQTYANPTGNMTAEIFATSTGVPTGSALAVSDNVDIVTIRGLGYVLTTFTFTGGNQISLTSGTKYLVACHFAGGDASNYLYAGYITANPNASEQEYHKTPAGSWESYGGQYDIIIDVYGTTGGPLIDKVSTTDAGFLDYPDEGDTHPFTSGTQIKYTIQSALNAGATYYWRARAIDPDGKNAYGAWPTAFSFATSSGGESTNIKSVSGTLKANIKEITGTNIANVKNRTGTP